MALLKGTNPECDEARGTMVRWNVTRVRRGLFRRERIEVSVELGFVIGPSMIMWKRPDDLPHALTTGVIQELVLLTGHDEDADVVVAKVEWLICNTSPKVLFFVVDLLKGQLETARADRDRLAETIQELRHKIDVMVVARKGIEQERDEARAEVAKLFESLTFAKYQVRDCVAQGLCSTWISSADGETIERGDNVFLGTDPERRLLLIDCAEAICAENLRVVGLPEGVPVFAKRDNARAWKRSQRAPISSPPSGAPAVPAMPTASPSGIGDGADTAAGEADLLDFIGVRP